MSCGILPSFSHCDIHVGPGSPHEEPGIAPTSGTAAPGFVWSVQAGAEEVLLV